MKKLRLKKDPILIENHDFKTILLKVVFPFEQRLEDLGRVSLLPILLNNYCMKYPSEEQLIKRKKEIFIQFERCYYTTIGTTSFLSFHMIIPDVEALGEDLLEEQFAFFQEVIYHPYVENGAFIQKDIDREKRNIQNGMKNATRNIRSYLGVHISDLIDEDGTLSRDLIHHPEQLDTVHGKDLYQFYKKLIENSQPVIYIMGSFDKDKMRKLAKKYLYLKDFKDKEITPHFDFFLQPREKVLEVEECSSFKDSSLSYVYKVQDMTEDDKIYLSVLKSLLTSLSSRLLQQKLRDKLELIYSYSVIPYTHYGAFEISVFIQKENVDIAKKALNEVFDDLKKDEVDELLINIKKKNHIHLLQNLDDKYFLMEDYYKKDLGIDISLEEHYQKIDKICAKDICHFIDRLKLDLIYFIKEEENESN